MVTRTFDKDPRRTDGTFNSGQTEYIVIGGPDLRGIAKEVAERKNFRIYTDNQVPVLWYSCSSSISDQREFLISNVVRLQQLEVHSTHSNSEVLQDEE